MGPQHRRILARHKNLLKGALRVLPFRSRALGITKPVFVYEPPGYKKLSEVHLLYLFRGHEREWVNIDEDDSRETTSIEDIDALITGQEIPPMTVIMPGLNSADNQIPSLGINMMGEITDPRSGLGSGRFWTFLTDELIPYVEARMHRKLQNSLRLTAGFSLGGYTASLLATAMPGYFHHAGLYDALTMFDAQIDPRTKKTDTVWGKDPIFEAALGPSENRTAMNLAAWNSTELIKNADPVTLDEIRETMFWIRSAAGDGKKGNHDRCRIFTEILRDSGITAGFNRVPFHPDALHNWHWNDRFLKMFLKNVFAN